MEEELEKKLRELIDKEMPQEIVDKVKKPLNDVLCRLEEDIEYYIKDDLAYNLSAFVADMARKTIQAILDGNQKNMERYLQCERDSYTGRSDSKYWGRQEDISKWHPIIHGKLFEQGAVALRKQIVEAHAELIKDQRILDLEDQVKSLVAQCNNMEAKKNDMWERLRPYLND